MRAIALIATTIIGSALLPAAAGPLLLSPDELTRSDLSAKDKRRVMAVTRPTSDFSKAETFERMQGGAATMRGKMDRNALSHSSADLSAERKIEFKLGDALFEKFWVSSPSSTKASDGLGPLFNARSCHSCHLNDGRGHPPDAQGGDAVSMVLRLARAPGTEAERTALATLETLSLPDPLYGRQLQDAAVPGLTAEGRIKVRYSEQPVTLEDGTIISLRKPQYAVDNLADGPFDPATSVSARIAPPMIGLGLLEAIHQADIAALADPDDKDGDGISGKPALARDASGKIVLGRFGWKAENPSVRIQSASAFTTDIGISSPVFPDPYGDCSEAQTACRARPHGVQKRLGDTEAPGPILDLVTFYAEHLAVPARRNVGAPEVLAGKRLFYDLGCASCHNPKFVTRRDAKNEAHAFQLIWPYSDMLLHDMGEGLADGQSVGLANGREWRTPPLWGIGLTKTVSGHTYFLHDGRARNLTEAILWHGGEAKNARDGFASHAKAERAKLIAFLESL